MPRAISKATWDQIKIARAAGGGVLIDGRRSAFQSCETQTEQWKQIFRGMDQSNRVTARFGGALK
jgi:hypothetical protein